MKNTKENQKNSIIYDALVEKTKYSWDTYSSLPEYLKESFITYHRHIKSLEGYVREEVIKRPEISVELHAKIYEVFLNYLQGKLPKAYDLMSESFNLVKDILTQRSERLKKTDGQNAKFVFKARVQREGRAPFSSRKDMFHIPFEERHIVKGQRFSIHGVPSVYLGESIYDCYLELGKPDLDKFWVSLFYFPLTNGIKLMDLTFANQRHSTGLIIWQAKEDDSKYRDTLDELVQDILLWPLIMACSIVCRFPDAPFKQEYIIPQMLYQLCSAENEFNGVRYYSTKLDEQNRITLQNSMINYALPAQDIKISGYCPYLASRLRLTEPITAKHCNDKKIESMHGYTTFGFHIISKKCNALKDDEIVLALDRMTMYFNQLVLEEMKTQDFRLMPVIE